MIIQITFILLPSIELGFGIFILLAALLPKQKLKSAHGVKQSCAINPAD